MIRFSLLRPASGFLSTLAATWFALAGLGGVPATALPAAAGCAPAWHLSRVQLPSPQANELLGVAAIGVGDVWAVGWSQLNEPTITLAEHWDGSAWTVVPTPNPETNGTDVLNGVGGASSSDVWAVGYNGDPALQTNVVLAEHWNGSSWTTSPALNEGRLTQLSGVSADAADDAWAVGFWTNNAGQDQTLAQHWDGSAWTIVPTPSPSRLGQRLEGVVALDGTHAWAVGHYYDGNDTSQALVEQWNGTTWQAILIPPLPGGGDLSAIAAASSSDVWAVGVQFAASAGLNEALVEHYDGSAWSQETTPFPPGFSTSLTGVAALGPHDVWAGGSMADSSGFTYTSLTEHWDGVDGSWDIATAPTVGQFDGLNAVSSAGGQAWAVGGPVSGFNGKAALAEANCPVQVGDSGFQPVDAMAAEGSTLAWSIPSSDSGPHSVTDPSGMDLFDSGSRGPGSSFVYTFVGAGLYSIADTVSGHRGGIAVPVKLPGAGTVGTPFTVTWASGAPPAGAVFDVQVMVPGSTTWSGWQQGVATLSAAYTPSAAGTYRFRGRIRNATGRSGWSLASAINVT